ncbi:MAG: ATP-binding protein [Sedimentisphaerales bacterium]|nr:ATP-binding protein [Sedimentisphaerales bacterium]
MINSTNTSITMVKNLPNAGKLIQSLRHLDYHSISAVCDIVDNSLDANASQIWVNIISNHDKGVGVIEIIDDGVGMDIDILDQALKLGSETNKNPMCDLGLYGMGLITASISMGRRLEVYTKSENSPFMLGIQDVDSIVELNDFIKEMREMTEQEIAEFSQKILDLEKKHKIKIDKNRQYEKVHSATLVRITKIDKMEWARSKAFEEALKRNMGQTFRKFIQAEKCHFYVNGIEVNAIDPINDYEPKILHDDRIELNGEEINIRVAELKDYGMEINRSKGLNIQNQGFYVLRNNREIASGETFSLFTKHNDYNLLRIEFSYPATLDSILNTTFSKQKMKLEQNVADKLKVSCNPFIRQVSRNSKQKQKDNRERKEDFSEVAKQISRKVHLLKTPKAEIEQRDPKQKTSKQGVKQNDHSPRLDITKKKRIDIASLKVDFKLKSMGEKAPLFEPDQIRDVVIVNWNTDHPFYLQVIAPNSDEPSVFNPLAYLVYCYSCAELISKDNSDTQEIIDNIRWEVGKNLAVLMH